jgi:DNA-binding CsgD family transcriptional regulator/tetratricopeptide (TPR) repeat protein
MRSPVLIGRAAELSVLAAAFATTSEGAPGAVLVGGETGVGKSRLVAEFAAHLAGHARVLSGSCLELGTEGLPFAPFTAVLRGLVRQSGLSQVLSLLPRGEAGDLGRLLPALGPLSGTDTTGLSRTRLFEQMLTLLEGLADQLPTVLIIEDAHWADRSSQDLLAFIVQHCAAPLLTVVTYRSDCLGPDHPLRPILAELTRASRVRSLELGRLRRAEVAEQLSGLLDAEPDPALVDQIYHRSGGNPLFVEALLADGGSVPGSIRDLLVAPVWRMPYDAQEGVKAAAMGGDRIRHSLLAAVTGWSDSALSAALRPAVAAHVLEAEEDCYLFRHSLIRDSVDADMLPGERAGLHLRYAEVLQAQPSLSLAALPSVELARHWRQAGRMHEPKAVQAAWQAAAEGRATLAFAEESHMLAQVLELWDRVPDAAGLIGADRGTVLASAIQAASSAGLSDRALSLIDEALAEPGTDHASAALLLRQRGELRHELGLPGDIDDLQRAVQLMPPGHPSSATVLNALASRLLAIPREAQGLAAAEAAMQAAHAACDSKAEAMAAINVSYARARAGDVDGQLACFATARALASTEGDTDWAAVLHAYRCEADILQGAGRYQQAAAVARRGLAAAAQAGLARTAGPTQGGNLAEALICLGQWDEADEILQHALELAPPPSLNGYLLVLRGSLDLARGDLARARASCGYAREVFTRGTAYAQDYLLLVAFEAELQLAQGQPAAAAALVADALADGDTRTSARYLWPVLVSGARAAAAIPDPGPLQEALRTAAGRLPAIGPVQHAHRQTFAAETSDCAAPADWDRCADAWAGLQQPYPRAEALLRAAEAAIETGSMDAGRLRTAAGIADQLGAQPMRERVNRLARLARIGEISADAPESQGPSLTPRERQVLQLVADGYTNGQIATELFISVKTASAHVSNILGKLNVSTRVQAATAAYRLNLIDPP